MNFTGIHHKCYSYTSKFRSASEISKLIFVSRIGQKSEFVIKDISFISIDYSSTIVVHTFSLLIPAIV